MHPVAAVFVSQFGRVKVAAPVLRPDYSQFEAGCAQHADGGIVALSEGKGDCPRRGGLQDRARAVTRARVELVCCVLCAAVRSKIMFEL